MLEQNEYLDLLKEVAKEVRSYPEWMRQYVFDCYGYVPAGGVADERRGGDRLQERVSS